MSAPPHADPGRGVFETMLVLDGRPIELEAHLERLEASAATLYRASLPRRTEATVIERAAGIEHGKLRLTAIRGGDGWLRTRISTADVDPAEVFPPSTRGVSLRGVVVAGGLGAHKWADRRLLERAAAEIPPGELPLLLDSDGAVLEVSRGSVFAMGGQGLATRPLDGRILPGIARRQAIEIAREEGIEVRERRLELDDLRRGGAFLAGSVRGIEPVRSLDGAELPPPGALSARVAAGLRRRWLRASAGEPVAAASGGRRAGPLGR